MIIDEAAYINKQLYDETIRALTNMRDCGLIAISTPLGPDNFISMLIDMTNPDGTPFYNVLHLTTVCDKCKLLPTVSERSACTHTWLPSWKSQGKQERNRRVGAVTGSSDTTAQEDCGLIVDGANGKLFMTERLKKDFNMMDLNRVYSHRTERYKPSRIYMSCDPNADGASNTAVCSGFWVPPAPRKKIVSKDKFGRIRTEVGFELDYPRFVFLGMDVSNTGGSEDKDDMILNHVAKIRKMCNQFYDQIPIFFFPERGTGSFTSRCHEILRNVPSVETVREGGGELYGVYKSDTVTSGYVETWKSLSNNGRIKFHSEFFTLSDNFVKEKEKAYGSLLSPEQMVVKHWREEMSRMSMIGGKITGKGKDKKSNDDMAIAGMMVPYWSQQVENPNAECYADLRAKVWVPLAQKGYHLNDYSLNFKNDPKAFKVRNEAKKALKKAIPGLDDLNLLPKENRENTDSRRSGRKQTDSKGRRRPNNSSDPLKGILSTGRTKQQQQQQQHKTQRVRFV